MLQRFDFEEILFMISMIRRFSIKYFFGYDILIFCMILIVICSEIFFSSTTPGPLKYQLRSITCFPSNDGYVHGSVEGRASWL